MFACVRGIRKFLQLVQVVVNCENPDTPFFLEQKIRDDAFREPLLATAFHDDTKVSSSVFAQEQPATQRVRKIAQTQENKASGCVAIPSSPCEFQ